MIDHFSPAPLRMRANFDEHIIGPLKQKTLDHVMKC